MQNAREKGKERDAVFTALMEQYANDVLRQCYMMLRDRSLAEDAMQECFLRAYKHLDDVKCADAPRAWLARTAMNICRDMLKRSWFRHENRAVVPEDLPQAATAVVEDEGVAEVVMQLEMKLREVILMRYYHGLTPQESIRALGISSAAYYRRLNKAHAILREKLKGWDEVD